MLASCLAGEIDDLVARRVHRHLGTCHRAAAGRTDARGDRDPVARRAAWADPGTLDRMWALGERLVVSRLTETPPAPSDPLGAPAGRRSP
jgi:hypothetical protein